jgi:diadenosine tetraphosphate (Ap4A) HIT family hydrolase
MVDYNQLLIKSYKHWEIYLHENQCYIGRIFALLKDDEHVEDFLALDKEMRDEFFQVGQEVKSALKALFQPDKMNYAALSNHSPRIHENFKGRSLLIHVGGKTMPPTIAHLSLTKRPSMISETP